MQIEMSEQMVNNLRVFLGRVQITGNEAQALLEIATALPVNKPVDKPKIDEKLDG